MDEQQFAFSLNYFDSKSHNFKRTTLFSENYDFICVDLDSGQNFKIHYTKYFFMFSSITDKLPEFFALCGLYNYL